MNDLISRQGAIELMHSLYPSAPIMRMNRKRWEKKYKPYIEAEKALEMLPPAQSPYNTDEWCHDCKEYDQERYSCPRWNRVIRKTVDELRAEQAERREG